MPYASFRLLYPPRARHRINPSALAQYKGYFAQYKYNDIRNVIYVLPDGNLRFATRLKEVHREVTFTEEMEDSLRQLALPKGYFHVLDSGVLRKYMTRFGQPIILWDVLVFKSRYLLGSTYRFRYSLLEELTGKTLEPERETGSQLALTIHRGLWRAPVFLKDFTARYREALASDLLEGLLLKDPSGKLARPVGENNNDSWQLKVRKPATAYAF